MKISYRGMILLSLVFLTIYSCKKDKKEEQVDKLTPRKLTDREINIAKNICESFSSKKDYFLRLSPGDRAGQFDFRVYFQECGYSLEDKGKLRANFDPSSYTYNTSSRYSRFFSAVIDDEKGPLKDFCYEIIDRNNKSIENIVDNSNQKLVYGFYKNGNYVFEIDTYVYEDNRWKKLFIDYYEVIKTSDRKNGMVKNRSRKAYCVDGKSKLIKQILL